MPDRPAQPVVKGRHDVTAHGQDDDRQGQRPGDQRVAAQGGDLLGLAVDLIFTGFSCDFSAIAHATHRIGHHPRGDGAGDIVDMGLVGRDVERRVLDPRKGRQRGFDPPRTGRTGGSGDIQPQVILGRRIARLRQRLCRRFGGQRSVMGDLGLAGGQVDPSAGHARHARQRGLCTPDTAGTGKFRHLETQQVVGVVRVGCGRRRGLQVHIRPPASLK